MKRIVGSVVGALGVLAACGATADPRLDEKVYSPYTEKGVGEIELRDGRELGGGALAGVGATVFELEYGVSDRLSLALVGAVARADDAPKQLDALGLEAVAYTGQIPGVGVDTGVYLEYAGGLRGQNDKIEAKLLLAKTAGRFEGLLNLIVEKPLSAPAGEGIASYGYAASASWRTLGGLRLGAEAFGDLGSDHAFLGRQGAYIGPQVRWRGRPKGSPAEIHIDVAWLAPVGTDRAEARGQVRLGLELERRF